MDTFVKGKNCIFENNNAFNRAGSVLLVNRFQNRFGKNGTGTGSKSENRKLETENYLVLGEKTGKKPKTHKKTGKKTQTPEKNKKPHKNPPKKLQLKKNTA